MSATDTTQLEITEFTPETKDLFPEIDEWGPTMDTPIPTDPVLPGGVDERQLTDTGLAPSDYELVSAQVSADVAKEYGFHPDDRHRPSRREIELENDGFRKALETQHEL